MVFMSINMLCKAMQNVGQKKAVWKYIYENYTYYVKWCKTTDYDTDLVLEYVRYVIEKYSSNDLSYFELYLGLEGTQFLGKGKLSTGFKRLNVSLPYLSLEFPYHRN